MIRFDEVPQARKITYLNDDGVNKTLFEGYRIGKRFIGNDGLLSFTLEPDAMVELVDVCKNCRHFTLDKSGYGLCKGINMFSEDHTDKVLMNEDLETFSCSEFKDTLNGGDADDTIS